MRGVLSSDTGALPFRVLQVFAASVSDDRHIVAAWSWYH